MGSGNTITGASPTRVLLISGNNWFFRPTSFLKLNRDKLKVLKGTPGLSEKLPKLDQFMATALNIVATVTKLAKLVPPKTIHIQRWIWPWSTWQHGQTRI